MFLTVTPNPAVDKTFHVERVVLGEKNTAVRVTAIAGGKGVNVARALQTLGQAVTPLVVVAGSSGEHVIRMMAADGLAPVAVWTAGETRTITTVLEEGQHRQTPLFEPGAMLNAEAVQELLRVVEELLPRCTGLTLNGTIPNDTPADLYAKLIHLARTHGVPVALDSHGKAFADAVDAAPDLVKPNLQELEEFAGRALADAAGRMDAIENLHARGVNTVLLSLGADGCIASQHEGPRIHAVPPRITEINAVGSGDCFLAGFLAGRARGLELEEATRLAVAAGAANAATWKIGHFEMGMLEALRRGVTVTEL